MTETLSIRLDPATKHPLDALSRQSKRFKSFPAAEAIGAYVEQEEWKLGEIESAVRELDAGQAAWQEPGNSPHFELLAVFEGRRQWPRRL